MEFFSHKLFIRILTENFSQPVSEWKGKDKEEWKQSTECNITNPKNVEMMYIIKVDGGGGWKAIDSAVISDFSNTTDHRKRM